MYVLHKSSHSRAEVIPRPGNWEIRSMNVVVFVVDGFYEHTRRTGEGWGGVGWGGLVCWRLCSQYKEGVFVIHDLHNNALVKRESSFLQM